MASVRWPQRAELISALLLLFLFALNLHRFQPWAYQFMLLGCLAGLGPTGALPARTLLLTASLYGYSAWSKFQPSFLNETGSVLASLLVEPTQVPGAVQSLAQWAVLFPALELAVGLGMLTSRTRKLALMGSLFMHSVLIGLLGPWGLQHAWPVLLWNGYFLIQNLLLLRLPTLSLADAWGEQAAEQQKNPWTLVAGRSVLVGCLLWPALAPWGWCDDWPAWALYSSRGAKVRLLLNVSQATEFANKVPAGWAPYLVKTSAEDWQELRLDWWSLKASGAPLYPAPRFSVELACWVGSRLPEGVAWEVQLESRSGPPGVPRERTYLRSAEEAQSWQDRRLWSVRARD